MGMPTVSVYVLTATLLAPSMVKLGVSPMAAHMFVMYFGMLSMITPPVAIAAYAAANIARVPGWTDRLDRGGGRLDRLLHSVPVRDRAEHADERPAVARSAWNFARNILGIFVGTAAWSATRSRRCVADAHRCSARAALAILIPQHAFPGADVLDWVGLAGAIAALTINYVQSRAGKRTAAPQAAQP